MSTDQQQSDFSLGRVPDEWRTAEAGRVGDHDGNAHLHHPVSSLPVGTSVDMFSAIVAGLLASLVAGTLWFWLDSAAIVGRAGPAIPLAVFIAVAVRIGGGYPDPLARTALSIAFYLATLSLLTYIMAKTTYALSYGSSPDFAALEQDLLHRQFRDPLTVATWLGGFVACGLVSQRTSHP